MRTWFILGLAGFVLAPQLSLADVYPYPSPVGSESSLDVAVVYDGEGEATVAAELEIGGAPTELKGLTLDIAGTSVRVLRAFYRYQTDKKVDGATCEEDVVYAINDSDEKETKKVTYHCVSLLEAKADPAADSVRETVTFPVPLAAGESARLTVVYKAQGTVKQAALAVSNFAFDTPLVPLDLASVRVRVDVTDELYLKGGGSDTNYSGDEGSLAEGLAVATLQSFSNKYASGLDYGFSDSSAYIKSTSNLDPNESFTVTGMYASSWFALSWLQLLIAVLVLILLIWLIIWGERRAAQHTSK